LKVVGNNPLTPYIAVNGRLKLMQLQGKQERQNGVVFFICKLPPEDMQIRPTFSIAIVGLEPSFPMIPGLSM
jgi:hypothetical protein